MNWKILPDEPGMQTSTVPQSHSPICKVSVCAGDTSCLYTETKSDERQPPSAMSFDIGIRSIVSSAKHQSKGNKPIYEVPPIPPVFGKQEMSEKYQTHHIPPREQEKRIRILEPAKGTKEMKKEPSNFLR